MGTAGVAFKMHHARLKNQEQIVASGFILGALSMPVLS